MENALLIEVANEESGNEFEQSNKQAEANVAALNLSCKEHSKIATMISMLMPSKRHSRLVVIKAQDRPKHPQIQANFEAQRVP